MFVNQGLFSFRLVPWLWATQSSLLLLPKCKVKLLSTNVSCKGTCKICTHYSSHRRVCSPFRTLRKQTWSPWALPYKAQPVTPGTDLTRPLTLSTNMSGAKLCVVISIFSHFILTMNVKSLRHRHKFSHISTGAQDQLTGRLWIQTQVCLPPKPKFPNPGLLRLQKGHGKTTVDTSHTCVHICARINMICVFVAVLLLMPWPQQFL